MPVRNPRPSGKSTVFPRVDNTLSGPKSTVATAFVALSGKKGAEFPAPATEIDPPGA
jgi:hypothetical protein